MKVTDEQARANRAALISAAQRLFRQYGFQRVSVAQIAHAAGLTHGAFYSHFASKQEVEEFAISGNFETAAEVWADVVRRNPVDPLRALVEGFLKFDHTAEGEVGCAFVALGGEMARGSETLRKAASRTLPAQLAVLESIMEAPDESTRSRRALTAYAHLVGAAVMVQSLADPRQVEQIRSLTVEAVLGSKPD